LLLQLRERDVREMPLAYVVHVGDAAASLARRVAEELRNAGHAIIVNAGSGSFKAQMKRADASGARYALIIGDDESAAGTIAIKPLRESGAQRAVAASDVVKQLAADGR